MIDDVFNEKSMEAQESNNITVKFDRKLTSRNRNIPSQTSARYLGGMNDIGSVHYSKKQKNKPTLQPVFQRQKFVGNELVPIKVPKQQIVKELHRQSPITIQHPQPFAKPAIQRTQPSHVLNRTTVSFPKKSRIKKTRKRRVNKTQFGLVSLALFIFAFGITINVQTIKTNHSATVQVAALAKKANNASSPSDPAVPSTTKPTAAAIRSYVVAPDLPRYLRIDKLHVNARVLQVGITANGALSTPNNVYDAAWYTGSTKPGQSGATVIDGHISSWSSHGVFYNLNKLIPGDIVQIVKGDNSIINYKVIRTQTYSANNVDMQAAITPVTRGVSGLNLISCTGDVLKGTSQYSERIIVYTQQV